MAGVGPSSVALIVTEHRSFLTDTCVKKAEALAQAISDVSGCAVVTCQYVDLSPEFLRSRALVLSGSSAPWDMHRQEDLRDLGTKVQAFQGPVLGICAGMQLLATFLGARLGPCRQDEVGFTSVEVDTRSDLFAGSSPEVLVYQEHTDEVSELPDEVHVIARNEACEVQALAVPGRRWWGTQFHPELADDLHPAGHQILARALQLMLSPQSTGTPQEGVQA